MNAMPLRVFYSYSHQDDAMRQRLNVFLRPLVQQKRIVEWHDRKIGPGADWASEISSALKSADIILFLVSPDFLASEYCFGVEVDEALARLKRKEVLVVPVLLKKCLWKDSRFSELQHIPRDGKDVASWNPPDDGFNTVAEEIRDLIGSWEVQRQAEAAVVTDERPALHASIDLVRTQMSAYATLYERTRQRMRASDQRTQIMERLFDRMRSLALSAYPLLPELSRSLSPGERLAAVSILQVIADEHSLPFLVHIVGSDKPFVGYQAAKALRAAVDSIDPRAYPQLLNAIRDAHSALQSAEYGFDSGRQRVLEDAESELRKTLDALDAARQLVPRR